MTILLPDEGALGELEDALDADMIDRIIDDIHTSCLNITMQLFKSESCPSLGSTLAAMGIHGAFHEGADFSGITNSGGLWIYETVHQEFVSVDEEGSDLAHLGRHRAAHRPDR